MFYGTCLQWHLHLRLLAHHHHFPRSFFCNPHVAAIFVLSFLHSTHPKQPIPYGHQRASSPSPARFACTNRHKHQIPPLSFSHPTTRTENTNPNSSTKHSSLIYLNHPYPIISERWAKKWKQSFKRKMS